MCAENGKLENDVYFARSRFVVLINFRRNDPIVQYTVYSKGNKKISGSRYKVITVGVTACNFAERNSDGDEAESMSGETNCPFIS